MASPQCYFMLSQGLHLFSPEGHLKLQSLRWGTLKVTSTVGRETLGTVLTANGEWGIS